MNNTILDLKFSYNWNKRAKKGKETGKLDCACFSTLRLDQPKYRVGQVYRVILEGSKTQPQKVLGYARAMVKNVFKRDQITEGVALLDTGYGRNEVLDILKRMYPMTGANTPFCFVILKYMNDEEIEQFSRNCQYPIVLE